MTRELNYKVGRGIEGKGSAKLEKSISYELKDRSRTAANRRTERIQQLSIGFLGSGYNYKPPIESANAMPVLLIYPQTTTGKIVRRLRNFAEGTPIVVPMSRIHFVIYSAGPGGHERGLIVFFHSRNNKAKNRFDRLIGHRVYPSVGPRISRLRV